MHLDFPDTIPPTVFAPAAFDVKRKSARFISPHSGSGKLREEHANLVKNLDVGDGVAARGSANGFLVDCNHLIQLFEPGNA